MVSLTLMPRAPWQAAQTDGGLGFARLDVRCVRDGSIDERYQQAYWESHDCLRLVPAWSNKG